MLYKCSPLRTDNDEHAEARGWWEFHTCQAHSLHTNSIELFKCLVSWGSSNRNISKAPMAFRERTISLTWPRRWQQHRAWPFLELSYSRVLGVPVSGFLLRDVSSSFPTTVAPLPQTLCPYTGYSTLAPKAFPQSQSPGGYRPPYLPSQRWRAEQEGSILKQAWAR